MNLMKLINVYSSYLLSIFFVVVSLQFEHSSYDFAESDGLVQLDLVLDGPLECCSIAVTVKIENINAIGNHSFNIIVATVCV